MTTFFTMLLLWLSQSTLKKLEVFANKQVSGHSGISIY